MSRRRHPEALPCSAMALKGAPHGYTFPIREVRLAAGAGYLYALAGDILTMPGMPSHPRAAQIDVDEEGRITGLV